jgi:precorrin-3B synthase
MTTWDALAHAATTLGNGTLDLTGRGNVQLRGLRPQVAGDLEVVLRRHGLLPSRTHERARNIVASALSGLDDRGTADVGPLVPQLDAGLLQRPRLADLSGRFLFGLDDGRGDIVSLDADLTAVAVSTGEFRLLAAGFAVGVPVPATHVVASLLDAAHAFLDLRDEQGHGAWRVRELVGSGAALAAHLGWPATNQSNRPNRPIGHRPSIGPIYHDDHTVTWVVASPLGRLSAKQARLVTQVAREAEGTLRITPWRTLVLPRLASPVAKSIADRLEAAGLVIDATSAWAGISACAGIEGCGRALADVRSDAAAAVRVRASAAAAQLHWSGCARRCGRPAYGATEVVAEPDGYRLIAEGQPDSTGLDTARVIQAVAIGPFTGPTDNDGTA